MRDKNRVNFSVQLDWKERDTLQRLARREQRKPGDYIRFLIRREAERLKATGREVNYAAI